MTCIWSSRHRAPYMYLEFQHRAPCMYLEFQTKRNLHVSGVPELAVPGNQSHLDLARRFLIPVPLRVVVVLVPDLVMSDPLQGVRPSHGDHPLHYGHVVERHLDKLPLIVVLGTPATLM